MEHNIATIRVGDLVQIVNDCTGFPANLPEDATIWEGNSPKIKADTIGLVISILKYSDSEPPTFLLLIGSVLVGICGTNLARI